jgi:hypothetical protein
MKFNCRLVFEDWRDREHRSIYNTPEGVELSMGSFHSGTTFEAELELDPDDSANLAAALRDGYRPVFYAVLQRQEEAACP